MNNPIEELQDLNLQDLYMKLQLSDNDFDNWLITMELLHGSQTCGNQMTNDLTNSTSQGQSGQGFGQRNCRQFGNSSNKQRWNNGIFGQGQNSRRNGGFSGLLQNGISGSFDQAQNIGGFGEGQNSGRN